MEPEQTEPEVEPEVEEKMPTFQESVGKKRCENKQF